jgi:hypothetical protein
MDQLNIQSNSKTIQVMDLKEKFKKAVFLCCIKAAFLAQKFVYFLV